jgi:hypothetical protein
MLPIQPAYPFPLPERKESNGALFAHQSCAGEETREGEDSSIKVAETNAQTPGETMVQTTSAVALCRGSVGENATFFATMRMLLHEGVSERLVRGGICSTNHRETSSPDGAWLAGMRRRQHY